MSSFICLDTEGAQVRTGRLQEKLVLEKDKRLLIKRNDETSLYRGIYPGAILLARMLIHYRLSNIHAAIGFAQFEKLHVFEKTRNIWIAPGDCEMAVNVDTQFSVSEYVFSKRKTRCNTTKNNATRHGTQARKTNQNYVNRTRNETMRRDTERNPANTKQNNLT